MISTGENGSKLDKIFDKIERMFEGVSTRQDDFRDQIKDIQASNATMSALRQVQDEMRTHVEQQDKRRSDETMILVDTKLGAIRQAIMSDTEKLLREHLTEWMEAQLKPMVTELIEAQEAARKAERKALLGMWRERVALATAVVVLLWAFFNPFSNASDARETSRIGTAIEKLDDIAQ
jgi:DNA-binding FrmR family transcriptional regulator